MAPAEWKKQNVHLSISRISAQKEKVETRLTLLEGILTSDNLKKLDAPSDDVDRLLSDDGGRCDCAGSVTALAHGP